MRCKKSTKWSLRLSSKLCYKDVHNWPKTDVNSKCSHQDCLYDSRSVAYHTDGLRNRSTRVVPKVMSNVFLLANWEQQTKESAVVDRTSCCVILECLMTSIACDTWLVSLLTKWPTTICRFASVLSSNSLWKRKSPAAEIHQRLQRAYGSVCMGASSVRRWVKHFKDVKTEEIQKAVSQCLRMAGTELYRRGIFKLPERWKKCVQRSGDYVEK